MLYAQYEQRSGLFRLIELGEGGIERVADETKGYAGRGPHLNKPESQHLMTWGPIPRGEYRIKEPVTHKYLGPVCFYLEPRSSNQMFGRSGFAIHGDNSKGDYSASHGCIILNRTMRNAIRDSGVRYLEVIEGARPSSRKAGD